jgi:hypothetical protein
MNQRILAKVILSLVCTFALLIPASTWAQEVNQELNRQELEQQERPDSNLEQNNRLEQGNQQVTPEQNQDNGIKSDTNREMNREKPAVPETEQNSLQNENRSVTERERTTETQRNYETQERTNAASQSNVDTRTDDSREELPATAGEVPLLGLIGLLSVATAAGTHILARAKR